MLQIFETSMRLPRPREDVFDFFADAGNLQRITPPELHFRVLTQQPLRIAEGTLIDYRLRLLGVSFSWQTCIDRWDPPLCFVDRQVRGPYRRWIHTHTFVAEGDETIINDRVEYLLPLPPFGRIVSPLVKWQLTRIFSYRQRAIRKLLAPDRLRGD